MADSFGKLVVRAYAPKRRAVLWTLAGLLIAGILYTAFELGRYDAGFRVVDSVRGALSNAASSRPQKPRGVSTVKATPKSRKVSATCRARLPA